jgi:hypothetical protein
MRRLVGVMAAVVPASVAAVIVLGASATGQVRADQDAKGPLARSEALAAAPALGVMAVEPVPAESARGVADLYAESIPLPSGGTFNGVRWEQAGGEFRPTEIATVLQYNAVCQWLRAWRDGRQVDVARQVIADAAGWPNLQAAEPGGRIQQLSDDVTRGEGEVLKATLADCDAAHAREVAYAESLRLPSAR